MDHVATELKVDPASFRKGNLYQQNQVRRQSRPLQLVVALPEPLLLPTLPISCVALPLTLLYLRSRP